MKKYFALAAALIMVLSFSGCLKETSRNVDRKSSRRSFSKYGPMENWGAGSRNQELDLVYAPEEEDSDMLTADVYWEDHEGLQPVLVNIHGGGWLIGDKRAANSVFRSRYLASRGFVVFNVNYRMLPGYPIQTQIEDVMGAVIFAKERAADYGGDPTRVGVLGGSAGGHLTAMVAWASGDDFFTPTGGQGSEYDAGVQAAVPFYGVFDLEEMLSLRRESLENFSFNFFTGGEYSDETMEKISPMYHLGPDLPPTFFVCGDNDEFGLYYQSVKFKRALEDLGVPTGLYTAHGAPHGFDSDYGADYTQEALALTAEWFATHLSR